jgi:transposase-like protein
MTGTKKQHATGCPQGGRRPTEGETAPERGRYSSRRKMEAVLRVLRSEDLDSNSHELGVTAATLSEWRDDFLTAGPRWPEAQACRRGRGSLARARGTSPAAPPRRSSCRRDAPGVRSLARRCPRPGRELSDIVRA